MKEPKLEESFRFQTIKEWQEANKRANELGLKGHIELIDYNPEQDDKRVAGKWVPLETSSKRS